MNQVIYSTVKVPRKALFDTDAIFSRMYVNPETAEKKFTQPLTAKQIDMFIAASNKFHEQEADNDTAADLKTAMKLAERKGIPYEPKTKTIHKGRSVDRSHVEPCKRVLAYNAKLTKQAHKLEAFLNGEHDYTVKPPFSDGDFITVTNK